EELAADIRRVGVRRITGDIVADPTIFAADPIAAGWLPRYFDELDATRISGLTVDAGRRIFAGGSQAVAADDPALEAASALRALLKEQGVKVRGRPRVVLQRTSAPTELARIT